jgi:hypothetical protein
VAGGRVELEPGREVRLFGVPAQVDRADERVGEAGAGCLVEPEDGLGHEGRPDPHPRGGGLGKSYLGGGLVVGVAYYAQWKVTADRLGAALELPGGGTLTGPGLENNKNKVFALGPDVTLPVATTRRSCTPC